MLNFVKLHVVSPFVVNVVNKLQIVLDIFMTKLFSKLLNNNIKIENISIHINYTTDLHNLQVKLLKNRKIL